MKFKLHQTLFDRKSKNKLNNSLMIISSIHTAKTKKHTFFRYSYIGLNGYRIHYNLNNISRKIPKVKLRYMSRIDYIKNKRLENVSRNCVKLTLDYFTDIEDYY